MLKAAIKLEFIWWWVDVFFFSTHASERQFEVLFTKEFSIELAVCVHKETE